MTSESQEGADSERERLDDFVRWLTDDAKNRRAHRPRLRSTAREGMAVSSASHVLPSWPGRKRRAPASTEATLRFGISPSSITPTSARSRLGSPTPNGTKA